MRKYRRYSNEFKRDLVDQVDCGIITLAAASREHNISPTLIERWRKQIHEGTFKDRKTPHENQLEKELDRYKKKVGELSLQVDLLKKLNSNLTHTRRSNGFIVTKRKSDRSEGDAK